MTRELTNSEIAKMRATNRKIALELNDKFGPTVARIRPEPIGTAHHFAPKYIVGLANTCPCCGHRAFWVGSKVADCGACATSLDIVRPLHPAASTAAMTPQTMARIALLSLRARIKTIGT